MKTVLRPLALLNVLAAIVFIFPVVLWFAVETQSRGTLNFEFQPAQSSERELEQIRSIKDIERLRRRAFMLEQMLDFDRRSRQADALFIRQLGAGLGSLLAIAAAGFLANAGLLFWALRR